MKTYLFSKHPLCHPAWGYLAAALVGCWFATPQAYGGTFSTDFTTQPANVQLYGDQGDASAGVIEDGVLKITKAVGSQQGGMIIDDLDNGEAISAFTATFKLLIGGGSGADGFSFAFGPDLPDGAFSEEGVGSGIIVAFDSYDNGDAEAPAIDLKVGGEVVASTKIAPRSALAANTFLPVRINLDSDGTVDVSYGDTVIYTNFFTSFTAMQGRFGLGARTGGSHDNHWVDDLSITTSTGPSTAPKGPLVTAVSPSGTGASPESIITLTVQDFSTQLDPNSIQLKLNDAAVTPSVSKEGEVTTITYDPPQLFASQSVNTIELVYADNGTPPVRSTNTYEFAVANYSNVVLPEPLFLETFDSAEPGSLPAGWTETNATTSINAGLDLSDPNSDSYLGWTVVGKDLFEGSPFSNNRLQMGVAYVNGVLITNLVENQFVYAESDNRSGNQIQMLFSPDYNLAGKTDVYVSYHSIYTQNQDNLGALEYSVDQGATWTPVVIMLDGPDILRNADGSVDAAATLNTVQTDTPEVDDGAGATRRTAYGEFLASKPLDALGPYIDERVNDNQTESKRVELFRLAKADNQANVRFRFVQAGTGSWYYGVDNFGLYSIPSAGGDQPELTVSRSGAKLTISWPAEVTGFVLQSSPSLTAPNWQPVPDVTGNSATIDIGPDNRFFILRK
ncbi:MAG: hypothetical protein AB9869_15055 [Verrucomicrobiia bacterium]